MESEDFNIAKESAKLYGYGFAAEDAEDDDFDVAKENAKLYKYGIDAENEEDAKEEARELVTEVRKRGN